MTQDELIELTGQLSLKELTILKEKGTEYARDVDALSNFKRLAETLKITPEKVLWVYLVKHLDAIIYFIETGKGASEETLEGRIVDSRNYLAILHAIFEERKRPGPGYSYKISEVELEKLKTNPSIF